MINYEQIGEKIKQERMKQNLKQDDLAKKIGFIQNKISRIESGKTADISIGDLLSICRGLNIGVEKLLFKNDNEFINVKGLEYKIINHYRTASEKDKKCIHSILSIEDNSQPFDKEVTLLIKTWRAIDMKYKKNAIKTLKECIELSQKDKFIELERSISETG